VCDLRTAERAGGPGLAWVVVGYLGTASCSRPDSPGAPSGPLLAALAALAARSWRPGPVFRAAVPVACPWLPDPAAPAVLAPRVGPADPAAPAVLAPRVGAADPGVAGRGARVI
jgi:hypothetical protein